MRLVKSEFRWRMVHGKSAYRSCENSDLTVAKFLSNISRLKFLIVPCQMYDNPMIRIIRIVMCRKHFPNFAKFTFLLCFFSRITILTLSTIQQTRYFIGCFELHAL